MRLVDTSAWIEWLVRSDLGRNIETKLPDRDNWVVPTIIQYELVKWLLRERDETVADAVLAFSMKCLVVPLTTEIAVEAIHSSRQHKLAMADAIVFTTASVIGADVLTCDKHFHGLPNVVYYEKA
jgi:predicted nucleic acid-binding protein